MKTPVLWVCFKKSTEDQNKESAIIMKGSMDKSVLAGISRGHKSVIELFAEWSGELQMFSRWEFHQLLAETSVQIFKIFVCGTIQRSSFCIFH